MNDAETRSNLPAATQQRLHALILRWHEELARGKALSAEEVCRDEPELVDEFRRATKPDPDDSVVDPPTQVSESLRAYANIPRPTIPGYQVLQALGRGGMGTVFLARQLGLNRLVAIKMLVMSGIKSGGDKAIARFRAEGEALARLQHPNVVSIHAVGEQDGNPYFVMEYVSGGSLAGMLRNGRLDPASAAAIVAALAGAAHATHKLGIIHRDLKPSNVLLQPIEAPPSPRESTSGLFTPAVELNGKWFVPKLTDYGLAKYLDGDQKLTRAGVALGTPEYMSPEQASGQSEQIGPTTDVWGLGAVLYELLTNEPPFHGKNDTETMRQVVFRELEPPRKLVPDCPPALNAICVRCLQKSPRNRYATAEELADDLRAFLIGDPIASRPSIRTRNAWPIIAGLMFVAGVALSALAIGWLQQKPALRAFASDPEIRRAAVMLRRSLADELWGRRSDDGWLPRRLDSDDKPLARRETWPHSHALAVLLMTPEFRGRPEDVRRSLFAPFQAGFLRTDADGQEIGWPAKADEGVNHTSSQPAMFTATALAAAHGRPDIADKATRSQILDELGRVERILRRHRPTEFRGGWNLFPEQQPAEDVYATATALRMLLEYRRHRLTYEGSEDRRDKLLQQTAAWLIDNMDADADPPGWRATRSEADAVVPGLTLQILTHLLQARMEAGLELPPKVIAAIAPNLRMHVEQRRIHDFDKTVKLEYQGRDLNGDSTRLVEPIRFLSCPWSVAAAARWQWIADPTDAELVRQVLSRTCSMAARGENSVRGEWLYVPTEYLEGLTAIPLP